MIGNTLSLKNRSCAEAPVADRGLEVAVGRRDHADVDAERLRAADALELAELEHAEQLALDLRSDLADLVEEQRAAVRELEPPLLLLVGAGEGALLVPEQLGGRAASR